MIIISETNPWEGSWLGTRKGKGILVGAIIATVVVTVIIVPLGIAGYITFLDSGKLSTQRGDTVDFYVGSYASNGTVFDSGTISNEVIGSNQLLAYIEQQLVDMEPGVKKTFVIPSEYGYTQ